MLHKILIKMGFTQSWADKCLYILHNGDTIILLIVNVDDIKFSGNNERTIQVIIDEFRKRFTIRLYEEDSKFLGISIHETDIYVKLHHQIHIQR